MERFLEQSGQLFVLLISGLGIIEEERLPVNRIYKESQLCIAREVKGEERVGTSANVQ